MWPVNYALCKGFMPAIIKYLSSQFWPLKHEVSVSAVAHRESFQVYQFLNKDIKGSREANAALMGISGATLEYQTDESLAIESLPILIKPDERCDTRKRFHDKPEL